LAGRADVRLTTARATAELEKRMVRAVVGFVFGRIV
jgi:hypothetical protein